MAEESFPMTPSGHERLKAELKRIKEVERLENVREIEAALEHGDLRENAEYHAAKERQAAIDARMRYVELKLGRAQIIDPTEINSDKVGFGATVTVLDLETEEELVYSIVGEDEADVDKGLISIRSPIARVLIGRQEGDEALLKLPKGDRELEIVRIEYKAIEV